MGIITIVCYRPKAGKEKLLHRLMRTHLRILRENGLATERDSIIMKAGDRTIVEVFEWKSQSAIDKAHKNPEVMKMWNKYFEVCDCIPLKELPESVNMFAGFTPFK